MTFHIAFALKVFAALFAIMNPIAKIPVLLALTEGADTAAQRKVAVTALIGTTIGCVTSITLRLMGMILAAVAVEMMTGALRSLFPRLAH